MSNRYRLNKNILKFHIFIVLFCIYIFPTGLINTTFPIAKLIFIISSLLVYFFSLNKINIKELLFIFLIFIFCLISKNIEYGMFITIILLDKVLKHEKEIKLYLKKSNILYICLVFTLIYSVLFFGTDGRYAFTAIKEINQSGLSIFCLAMLLIYKNKIIGLITLSIGLLTFSRSYYLAVLLFFLSKSNLLKKIINKNIMKKCNYFNITILSSILLFFLGLFYIYQYKIGNIFWGDNINNRLYTFLDYSNFFRFTAVINLVLLFFYYPSKLILGVTEQEFITMGSYVSKQFNIPYKYIVPHNLFYSHLKLYGIFSIFEIIYVSSIMKKITTHENFYIYIAIVAYSVVLGAGLYSYWLYLSSYVLIVYNGKKRQESVIN